MKKIFSKAWISSRKSRKQRKYRYNAPLHLKRKFLSACTSKEIRKKYGKRSIPLRKGDGVLILRGSFAKKQGKIVSVEMKRKRVVIEGINRKKSDGTRVNVYFDASKLQIQSLNLEDKRRIKALNTTEKELKLVKGEKDAP